MTVPEPVNADGITKEKLKELLLSLKGEDNPERIGQVKKDFKELLRAADPLMIATVEQELVGDGFSRDDLLSACDIHLELFRENVEGVDIDVPPDHPIARFMKDHELILDLLNSLRSTIRIARSKADASEAEPEMKTIAEIADRLLDAENHNIRQENTLFPLLERHGLEQPPAIMWMEHTEMKQVKKKLKKLVETRQGDFHLNLSLIENSCMQLLEQFASHTQKEQHILYKAALEVLTPGEWAEIREECDALGYFGG